MKQTSESENRFVVTRICSRSSLVTLINFARLWCERASLSLSSHCSLSLAALLVAVFFQHYALFKFRFNTSFSFSWKVLRNFLSRLHRKSSLKQSLVNLKWLFLLLNNFKRKIGRGDYGADWDLKRRMSSRLLTSECLRLGSLHSFALKVFESAKLEFPINFMNKSFNIPSHSTLACNVWSSFMFSFLHLGNTFLRSRLSPSRSSESE